MKQDFMPQQMPQADLRYNPGSGNRIWYDDDRQYLYPVPAQVIRDYESAGYKLSQNPNWN